MKKSLIALAALSAFAGSAAAQSSVTIYGAVGASNNAFERGDVKTAAQFQSAAQDMLGTTALGLFGTEDLGGGNKAFFRLEGDLSMAGQLGSQAACDTDTDTDAAVAAANNTTGTIAAASRTTTKANCANNMFNRHAHVGIETKSFGTVSIGRQNDSIKDLEGLGQVSNLSDNLHMNTLVGDRYAQVYKYATPTFNGLKATYSYSNNAANTGGSSDTLVNATTDGTDTLNSFGVSYVYQNYSLGYGKGTITAIGSDDKETSFFGARAVFGNVTVGAHLAQNKQGANELDQTMVSANYALGNIDLKGHYVKNKQTGSVIGTQSSSASGQNGGDGYGLMAVYNLSKRTSAYVGYADFDADTTSLSSKLTTVGLFHKF
jgi:predicted porin